MYLTKLHNTCSELASGKQGVNVSVVAMSVFICERENENKYCCKTFAGAKEAAK